MSTIIVLASTWLRDPYQAVIMISVYHLLNYKDSILKRMTAEISKPCFQSVDADKVEGISKVVQELVQRLDVNTKSAT